MTTMTLDCEEPIAIRSLIPGTFFSLHNSLIDHHAAHIGTHALALYTALARYAHHKTGKAWPSIGRLATLLDLSKNSVKKYLQRLKDYGLIHIALKHPFSNAQGKRWTGPLFTLLDPSLEARKYHDMENGDHRLTPIPERANTGPDTQGGKMAGQNGGQTASRVLELTQEKELTHARTEDEEDLYGGEEEDLFERAEEDLTHPALHPDDTPPDTADDDEDVPLETFLTDLLEPPREIVETNRRAPDALRRMFDQEAAKRRQFEQQTADVLGELTPEAYDALKAHAATVCLGHGLKVSFLSKPLLESIMLRLLPRPPRHG
jgi:hypothetical protein